MCKLTHINNLKYRESGVKLKIACLLTTGLVTVMSTSPAYAVVVPADSVTPLTINTSAQDISTLTNPNASLVNFDDVTPNPTMFFQAPPETITSTPATFTGGTVLGLATFFPAIVFASGQNVYGTADFGNTHSSTLSMSINSPLSNITHEVSFALFNGETFNQSYTVTTNFTDGTFATNSFSQIAPNWQSGYALVDLLFPALDISSIAINATNSGKHPH